MRQVRVHGPGDVRVDDVPDPDPGPADAVVRVAACGICGSDLSYIEMGGLRGAEPMCLGHEISGTVEWVGAEVTSVRAGDRVVVQPGNDVIGRIGNGAPEGGLTPSLLVTGVDRGRLHRIPDELPLDVAAFAEPLGVGMHAVEQADVGVDDAVCVFGCGPIGLAAVATLADRGNQRVVAVDLSPTRLDLARRMGAHEVVDPSTTDVWAALADIHGTRPFSLGATPATDAFIEASGAGRVLVDIIDHAAVGAHLSVVGLHYARVPTSFLMVLMKEITIRGSIEYPARFADAIDLLGRHEFAPLLTHRFDLDAFDDALSLLQGAKDCGKVLVTMPHPEMREELSSTRRS
jgi:threonine dehydrogenase-like Zn-dependent dehydrogenase